VVASADSAWVTGATIRLAPPLAISQEDLDWAVDRLADVIS
jgi:acetylornithine/succinyldiaminopimelate/putrescine aminotransferase